MRASRIALRRGLAALTLLLLAGALAGCETTGTPAPDAAAKPAEPPMTHQRAATECWMATEKGHADMSLDRRADIVTQCIDRKMKAGTADKPESKPASPAAVAKKKKPAAADSKQNKPAGAESKTNDAESAGAAPSEKPAQDKKPGQ